MSHSIKFYEIYYASNQESVETGRDGFGIRTYTKGFKDKDAIIEKLKERNLFFYDSGSLSLASSHELEEDLDKILSYPIGFTFFSILIHQKQYFILIRNIFIGRDYGWYLEPQDVNARSGNTFSHVYVFEENIPDNLFNSLIHNQRFIPFHWGDSQRLFEELKKLLTGKPELLPSKSVTELINGYWVDESEINVSKSIRIGLEAIYSAIQQNKNLVLRMEDHKTLEFLYLLFHLLPNFLLKFISFQTNYQQFNLESPYFLTCINEYYTRDGITPSQFPNLILLDLDKQDEFVPSESIYVKFVSDSLKVGDLQSVKKLNEFWDDKLVNFSHDIELDDLVSIFLYYNHNGEQNNFESIVNVYDRLGSYPLKADFKNKIVSDIIHKCNKSIEKGTPSRIATSLKLIIKYDLHKAINEEQKMQFSHLLVDTDLSSHLFRSGISLDDIKGFIHMERFITNPDFLFQSEMDRSLRKWLANKVFSISESVATKKLIITEALNASFFPTEDVLEMISSLSNPDFAALLEHNDYFKDLSVRRRKEIVPLIEKLWSEDLNTENSQDVISIINSKIKIVKKNPSTYPYYHHIVHELLNSSYDTEFKNQLYLILLDHYKDLGKKNLIGPLQDGKSNIIPILNYILENLIIQGSAEKANLTNTCVELQDALKTFKLNILPERQLISAKLEFIIDVIESEFNPSKLQNLKWHKTKSPSQRDPMDEDFPELIFVINNIPSKKRYSIDFIQPFLEKTIVDPHWPKKQLLMYYYNKNEEYFSNNVSSHKNVLAFHEAFIRILWGFRAKEKKAKNTQKLFALSPKDHDAIMSNVLKKFRDKHINEYNQYLENLEKKAFKEKVCAEILTYIENNKNILGKIKSIGSNFLGNFFKGADD